MSELLNLHAGKLRRPVLIGRLADAVTTEDLAGLSPDFNLFENPDDLFFGESGLFHFKLLS